MSLDEVKKEARRAAFARRKVAFAARRGNEARLLAEVLAGHRGRAMSGFMPMRTEIDPLQAMAAHKGPVGVPVIMGKGLPLRFRLWAPDARMVEGEFGALVPESGDWIVPEVLIVPLLAFDRRGYRLGYGGGFYDRTLAALRAAGPITAIGFAFAAQEVDKVPTDATDQCLDLVVTEAEVFIPAS
jgi:5-formyltetrahydrofolate cyclo-ligase